MADLIGEDDFAELQSMMILESIQLEAIVNLLERKGILSKKELEEEIRQIQNSLDSIL
ncbi:MAG TPA: hypothetical protein PK425_05710 [Syntrophales bacterium]|jgi:hypothetical protein|nr:hypothetical protein [Syntrophales bacterium]HQB14542.1 hypothetical protein [Syntrophales bacterium]